jgi:hypothetical protein
MRQRQRVPGTGRTAAVGANFGPDYQSPSRASFRPWRLCAPSHATPLKRWFPLPGLGCLSVVPPTASGGGHLSRKSFGTPRRSAKLAQPLASPLRPGRGVLIRSVSRRLGSVACVREDASPNEVSGLSNPRMPVLIPPCQTGPPAANQDPPPGNSPGLCLVCIKQLIITAIQPASSRRNRSVRAIDRCRT